MAVAYMTSIDIAEYDKRISLDVWEYEETITDAENGDTLILPENVENSSISLICVSGAIGKVQATNSILAKVKAGTANWIDWPEGEVAESTQDILSGATALRAVKTNAIGTLILEVRSK